MKGKLRKVDSNETICQSKIDVDKENICTRGLVIPILLTFLYVYFLTVMSTLLKVESFNDEKYKDPFKSVWISGPLFFTTVYLICVYYGQYVMSGRQEFRIKHYIFTYNVYQCLFNLWCVLAMIVEVFNNPHFKVPWGNSPETGVGGFRISFLVWLHYNNKYIELLDTVWMILRKKTTKYHFYTVIIMSF